MNFIDYCIELEPLDDQKISVDKTSVITFTNRNNKAFSIKTPVAIDFVRFLENSAALIETVWSTIDSRKSTLTQYEEKSYRAIFEATTGTPGLDTISSLSGSQTRQLTTVISKLICYLGEFDFVGIDTNTRFDLNSVRAALAAKPDILENLDRRSKSKKEINFGVQFKQWMIEAGLSESTAEKYSKTTGTFADKIVKSNNSFFPPLFSISEVAALDELGVYLAGCQ